MSTIRRTATDADLQVGTTVYRGQGRKPYQVVRVVPAEGHTYVTRYVLGQGAAAYSAKQLTVEVEAAPAPEVGEDRCPECGDFLDWCPRSGMTTAERTAAREARDAA